MLRRMKGPHTLQSYLPVTFTAFGSNGGTYQSSQYANNGDTLCAYSGQNQPFSPSATMDYCAGFDLPRSVTVSRFEVSGDVWTRRWQCELWDVSDTSGE